MLLLAAALCLSFSAIAVGNLVTLPARNRRARIRVAATYGKIKVARRPSRPRFSERILAPLAMRLGRVMLRLSPKQNLESVSTLLLSAGLRDTSPQTFLAAKAAVGCAGLVLGLAIGASSSATLALGLACMFGSVGYIAPAMFVSARARSRQAALAAELPDALDLLAVSVEAGLGFDGALTKLTEHTTGPLAAEFELALGEMRIGESRADALKKLAARSATPEVSAFVRAIVQADQLGTSLGRMLRIQASDARMKRQSAAEERAMKAPIKMLFPTVLFIFPAMFIVVLGPAMMSLGKLFGF
jgi:tight adherence protein C